MTTSQHIARRRPRATRARSVAGDHVTHRGRNSASIVVSASASTTSAPRRNGQPHRAVTERAPPRRMCREPNHRADRIRAHADTPSEPGHRQYRTVRSGGDRNVRQLTITSGAVAAPAADLAGAAPCTGRGRPRRRRSGCTTTSLSVSTGYSTKADSSAVHSHRISTLRRWPWPISISRWWRWPLSAVARPWRRLARRMMENSDVEDRHAEDQERHEQRGVEEVRLAREAAGCRIGAAADDARAHRHQQPEQQRAAVAHEDPRRVEVVRQEPDAHPER